MLTLSTVIGRIGLDLADQGTLRAAQADAPQRSRRGYLVPHVLQGRIHASHARARRYRQGYVPPLPLATVLPASVADAHLVDLTPVWDTRNLKQAVNTMSDLVSFGNTDVIFSPDEQFIVTGTSVKKGEGAASLVFFDRKTGEKVRQIGTSLGHPHYDAAVLCFYRHCLTNASLASPSLVNSRCWWQREPPALAPEAQPNHCGLRRYPTPPRLSPPPPLFCARHAWREA